MKYHTTIVRERNGIDGSEEEIPITVVASFQRASGDGWHESYEPAYWLVEDAQDVTGNEVVLTKVEIEDICAELHERSEDARS